VGGIFFSWLYYNYLCCIMIDIVKEDRLIKSIVNRLPEVDAYDTIILSINPEYSSILAQRIAHAISKPSFVPIALSVDIPAGDKEEEYLTFFGLSAKTFQVRYHKVIVCSTYTCLFMKALRDKLYDIGYEHEDLLFISLTEHWESDFRADVVGEYVDKEPSFYWQKDYEKVTTDIK